MTDSWEELSPPTTTLLECVLNHRARISVVGQGYVGLTMAAAAADAGFQVVGIDTDPKRIHDLAAGLQSVPGVDSSTYRSGLGSGRLSFSTEPDSITQADLNEVLAGDVFILDQAPDGCSV